MSSTFKVNIGEKTVGKSRIISDLSFSFFEGKIVAIIGPNGAGKTTLINCLLSPQDEKQIEFLYSDLNLGTLKINEYATYVSHLGASDFLMPNITLEKFFQNAAYKNKFLEIEFKNELEKWELTQLQQLRINRFSMGQFQRALLASALTQPVKLYLFDEPERHLDPNGIRILDSLFREKAESGKSVLFSTHDLNFALNASDIIVALGLEGKQEFYGEKELAFKLKIFDKIYQTEFSYHETPDGKLRVFV